MSSGECRLIYILALQIVVIFLSPALLFLPPPDCYRLLVNSAKGFRTLVLRQCSAPVKAELFIRASCEVAHFSLGELGGASIS